MLGRRLLMSAGGGGAFTTPVPAEAFLVAGTPNGGGSNWTLPRAIHLASGDTLLGWVDGDGNVECATIEDGTGTVSSVTTIHAAFETDAHNSPAFLRRSSDGRILAVYSKHNATPINLKISTNPDDPTAWGSATNLDSALGGTRYTDYQLHQLDDGTIWLIYRDEPSAGTDSRWCYSTSTDGGATWAAQTILYQVSGQRSYVVSWSDGARIHFIATNGGSTGGGYSGFTALFHFYRDSAGAWRQSDGTSMGSPPFDFTDATEAYVGTEAVFMENIAIDADGHPRVAGTDVIGGNPHAIALAWTGSAWVSADLGDVGTGFQYNTGGDYQAYGSCIDVADPDRLWVIRDDAGGQPEVFLYRTSDGATWSGRQITDGSSDLLMVISPVRDGTDTVMAFYTQGSWVGYTDWNLGTVAVGRI